MDKEELEFSSESVTYDAIGEELREFGNETRKIARENVEKTEALTEALKQEGSLPPAYGTPTYTPPKYPAGVTPLPQFLALLGKLCKPDETVGTCVARLKGEKQAEPPETKETCEKAGGTWDEETKTCKLPPKKEGEGGGQSLQGLGVLPSSGGETLTSDEARAKALTAKILGESE